MSWWRNTPTTARFTARPRSLRGRASRSIGRPWPSGSAEPVLGPRKSADPWAAAEIKPVWRLLRDELLSSTKLFVDETTAPVLDPGRGRTKKGYFWVLARDDRPWRGGAPPAVVYSYAPGRSGDHAAALLQGYTGVLQTDGYAAYRSLADPKRVGGPATLAFCWAHWRRQWFDLAKSPPAPIATEALKRIAELYQIEAEIRGNSADERRAMRQQKTKPLAQALKTWLERI